MIVENIITSFMAVLGVVLGLAAIVFFGFITVSNNGIFRFRIKRISMIVTTTIVIIIVGMFISQNVLEALQTINDSLPNKDPDDYVVYDSFEHIEPIEQSQNLNTESTYNITEFINYTKKLEELNEGFDSLHSIGNITNLEVI